MRNIRHEVGGNPVGRTVSREMSHLLDFDTLRSLLPTELVPALPEDVSPTTRDRYERVTADLRRREELHRRVISVINSMTAFERRYPLALHDESRQRLEAMTSAIVKKMLDRPISRLKDGTDTGLYMEALQDLFDIHPDGRR